MSYYDKRVPISELVGKTITKIEGLEKDSDTVYVHTTDGKCYKMYHEQECCEDVTIDDVNGDVANLLNSPIRIAEERTSGENPEGIPAPEYQQSFTWTFYTLATVNGYVDVRWYGESNGYYSESVDFVEVSNE